MQVVDKLQGTGKSKRDGWRTELPTAGLGGEVIDEMKDEKLKDVAWQGKCSGTVYVFHRSYHLQDSLYIKTLSFAVTHCSGFPNSMCLVQLYCRK